MTTFKSVEQLRQELARNKFSHVVNNGQVVVDSREEAEKLQARLNHSRRNTLTTTAFNRK